MGIRFRCHHCDYELHVKDFQGGKRGKCPECLGKFRIPIADAGHSLGVEGEPESPLEAESSKGTSSKEIASTSSLDSYARNEIVSPVEPLTSPSDTLEPAAVLPQALSEAPDATWYVRPATGGQFGPAASDVFGQWLAEKRVSRDSLIWRDGWPEWLVAAQVLSDYFGPQLPLESQTPPSQLDQLAPPASTATQPLSLGDRNRLTRKQRRKRNYFLLVAVLSVVTVGLVAALVVVLILQR